MTFVGKILVIVIMAFSLLFLGISTVVFTTSKNWMVATKAEQKKVEDLKKKLNDAKAASEAAKKELEDAKGAVRPGRRRQLENQLASLQDENTRNLAQITAVRGQVGGGHSRRPRARSKKSKPSGSRPTSFATQKSAVEKQANEFKLHQAELERPDPRARRDQLETATKNNSDLREPVAKFSTLLTKNGLSTDISQIKGLESPPPVDRRSQADRPHQPQDGDHDRL